MKQSVTKYELSVHSLYEWAREAEKHPENYRIILKMFCEELRRLPRRYYKDCYFTQEIGGDNVRLSRPTVAADLKDNFSLFMDVKGYEYAKWNNVMIGHLPAKNENLKRIINQKVAVRAMKNITGEVVSIYNRDVEENRRDERIREMSKYANI